MSGSTSIGPDDTDQQKGDKADRAITEGVDAQSANEKNMRTNLADAKAKPTAKIRRGYSPENNQTADPKDGLVQKPGGSVPAGDQQGAGADADRSRSGPSS